MQLISPSMTYRGSLYEYRDSLYASTVTIERWDDARVTITLSGPTGGLKEAKFSMSFNLLKAISHRSEALEVEGPSTAVLHLE